MRESGRHLAARYLLLAVALPLELVLGLLLAMHFQPDRPFKRLFVALLVLPAVVPPMVAGSMWRLMFDHKFGPFNQIIGWLAGEPIVLLWVVKPHLAFWSILIAEVWQWTPFMFIILLAALVNVDREQLEAAEIDGAGRFRVFFRIVLPAIMPVLGIALLIRALDLFRIFDSVWQLTRGGPGTKTETISIFMFVRGFQSFETSYTAALVVVAPHASLCRGDVRPQTHGDRAMRKRTVLGEIGWYACLAGHPRGRAVSDLLDVHGLAEAAGGDIQVTTGVVPK